MYDPIYRLPTAQETRTRRCVGARVGTTDLTASKKVSDMVLDANTLFIEHTATQADEHPRKRRRQTMVHSTADAQLLRHLRRAARLVGSVNNAETPSVQPRLDDTWAGSNRVEQSFEARRWKLAPWA